MNTKRYWLSLFLLALAITFFQPAVKAQPGLAPASKVYKIGIFSPIFLDSMFGPAGFKYGRNIPKTLMPGIDFVQGAMIALDSMKLTEGSIDVSIYDTKSYTQNIGWLIRNKKIDSLDLMIGSVKDAEYKQLADFALLKNIPFISATFPNDYGVVANPFTAIMNSTLRAHCEGIYSYLLQSHGTDKLYLVRKPGMQEDKVANYFKTINEPDGKPLLNIETVMYDSTFNRDFFRTRIDTNRTSIIIAGSLDESFATALAVACRDAYAKNPNLTLIGMPTWDNIAGLRKKDEFETFPIYFTTPYFNSKWDSYSKMVINAYTKKYKVKTPSDMAFRGFECTYVFTKLLLKYPNDMMSHLNDRPTRIFCDYNFRPVMLKKDAMAPDYFENKHVYFVRLLNGVASKAW